jgi:hypothetical protein
LNLDILISAHSLMCMDMLLITWNFCCFYYRMYTIDRSLKFWIVAVDSIWPWSFQELETFWPQNCNPVELYRDKETSVLEGVI